MTLYLASLRVSYGWGIIYDEFEGMWKEKFVFCFRCCPSIGVKVLRKAECPLLGQPVSKHETFEYDVGTD
jgi:hypothetical protein